MHICFKYTCECRTTGGKRLLNIYMNIYKLRGKVIIYEYPNYSYNYQTFSQKFANIST